MADSTAQGATAKGPKDFLAPVEEPVVQESPIQGATNQDSTTDDSNLNDPANTDPAATSDKPYGPLTKEDFVKEWVRQFTDPVKKIMSQVASVRAARVEADENEVKAARGLDEMNDSVSQDPLTPVEEISEKMKTKLLLEREKSVAAREKKVLEQEATIMSARASLVTSAVMRDIGKAQKELAARIGPDEASEILGDLWFAAHELGVFLVYFNDTPKAEASPITPELSESFFECLQRAVHQWD